MSTRGDEAGTAPVAFRERLIPRWPAWLVGGAVIAMIAVAYGAAFGAAVGWVLGLALAGIAAAAVLVAAPVVEVSDAGFRAGPAHLPRSAIGAAVALDAEAAGRARGRDADARDYVLLRTLHAPTAVRVAVTDPDDPHPSWLVTTRRPEALAAALASARIGP